MPLMYFDTIGQVLGGFVSFNSSGLNTDNDVTPSVAARAKLPCRIYRISAYFAGNGGTMTARTVAFRGNDLGLHAKSAQFTAPSGSAAVGGQTLNQQMTDGTNPMLTPDNSVYIGWWRNPASNAVWSVRAGGTFSKKSDAGADVGTYVGASGCGVPYTCGNIQAFADVAGGDLPSMLMRIPNARKQKHHGR